MAISLIGSVAAGGSGSTTTTAALDTTGASLIVVGVSHQQGTAVALSDSAGNTWTALTESSVSTLCAGILYYCIHPRTSATHTFTENTASNFSSVFAAAFKGSALNTFDQQVGNTSNPSTTVQLGSITPTITNELLITLLSYNGTGATVSIDSGFTITDSVDFLVSNHYGGSLAYLIQGGASSVNPTWTRVDSQANAARIATFKSALAPRHSIRPYPFSPGQAR